MLRVYDDPEYIQCRDDEILTAIGTNRADVPFIALLVSPSVASMAMKMQLLKRKFIVCKSGYVIWQAAKFWYGLNAFSLIALGIGLTALQDGAPKMVLTALQKRITGFQEARKHDKLKTT
jgi:hypothetical protein